MLVTYDSSVDALYIYVEKDRAVARTVTVDDGRNVDLDENDRVVGIEVLSASAGFEVQDLITKFGLESRKQELLEAAQEFRSASAS